MSPGFRANSVGDNNYDSNIIVPIFKHFRKTLESVYWRRHVCPSDRPSALKKKLGVQ
jgi:hypothetical protein